jgi:hypothetical protein
MNRFARWGLAGVAAAGLAIDAYVHLHIAHRYMPITTGTVNQGVLFQIEGALAIAAALWLLVRPGWLSAAAGFLVAAGGATAVLVYGFVNVGKIGPIPNMYDPEQYWSWDQKFSLAGELGAAVVCAALFAVSVRGRRAGRSTANVAVPAARGHA